MATRHIANQTIGFIILICCSVVILSTPGCDCHIAADVFCSRRALFIVYAVLVAIIREAVKMQHVYSRSTRCPVGVEFTAIHHA